MPHLGLMPGAGVWEETPQEMREEACTGIWPGASLIQVQEGGRAWRRVGLLLPHKLGHHG